MSKSKFMIGALFGAAVGAVAGILSAPKSGKDTRAEMRVRGEQVKSDFDKKAVEMSAKANKSAAEVKAKIATTVVEVKTNAKDLRTRTERAIDGAKKGFNETSVPKSTKK